MLHYVEMLEVGLVWLEEFKRVVQSDRVAWHWVRLRMLAGPQCIILRIHTEHGPIGLS
jgi:hypothetical protein